MQVNELNPLFIIIPILALGIALAYWSWKQEQARRRGLQSWCSARKLRYSDTRDSSVDERYRSVDLFNRGFDKYAQFFGDGNFQDFKVRSFDYHYKIQVQSGKHRRTETHWHTVCVIESPVQLEALHIRPENFLDKIGEFVGFDDIDFESAEFSKKFFVKAQNRKWAFDVLHARAMEFLLAQKTCPTMMFQPGALFLWMRGKQKAAAREDILKIGCGLLKLLPNYVIQERGRA